MAPTQLSVVKRELQDIKDGLHRVRKKQKKTATTRATLTQAPKISELLVPLLVGRPPDTEIVTIHGGLLPPSTGDFLAARRDDRYGVFCILEDQQADMVTLYRMYLYTGKVYSQSDEDRADAIAELNEDREWSRLAHLYFLGVTLRDETFANRVIDSIVEKVGEDEMEWNYPTGIAGEVYSHTDVGDPLRRLYVDLHVWAGKGKGVDPPHDDAQGPGQFLRDVLTGLSIAGKDIHDAQVEPPWVMNTCGRYHKHVRTRSCVLQEEAEIVDLTDA